VTVVMEKPSRTSATLCNASIVLYVLWLLLPAVQTTGRALTGVLAVGLFGAGVLLDGPNLKKQWYWLLLQAACAALMPILLFVFLSRGGTNRLGFFVQHGMFWFPLVFCSYARQRGDRRLWRGLKTALLAAVSVTVLTSIFWLVEGMFFRGDQVYAYARSLGNAEPGNEAYLKELMQKNIGGYDFVYAMVAALPLTIQGIQCSRGWKRAGFVLLTAAQTLMIVLSQYTYAMLYAALILAVEIVAALIRAISRGKVGMGASLLLGLVPFVLVWLFRMPLLSLAAGLCKQAGLENFAFSFEQLKIALEGGVTDETSRMAYYQTAVAGIGRSPLLGSMLGGDKLLSLHSDVLDLLSGMGILGTAAVCGMIWLMGRGSLQGVKQSPHKAQLCVMWLAVLVTATLGTVCYSRDVMAVAALGTLLVLEGGQAQPAGENQAGSQAFDTMQPSE